MGLTLLSIRSNLGHFIAPPLYYENPLDGAVRSEKNDLQQDRCA